MTRPRSGAEAVAIQAGDRVLVTGAAGFIGSAVTRQLVDRGARGCRWFVDAGMVRAEREALIRWSP